MDDPRKSVCHLEKTSRGFYKGLAAFKVFTLVNGFRTLQQKLAKEIFL